ncbi:MAG TPA: aldehyde dehydrogenase family protein [Pseudoduganella sp.]|jgi:aldehyde dehydrogenase (NAD+)
MEQSLQADIARVFQLQRTARGALKASNAAQRCARLRKLRESIVAHADQIDEALFLDLRKAREGAKNFEVASALEEIDNALNGLESWMRDEAIEPSPHFKGNQTFIRYEPRGVVLLFGPWNFPFSLVFAPLAQIIAAGNACIVKPNELQPHTSAVTAKVIRAAFPEQEVAVFEGGVPLAEQLLELPVDHIFFTGSPAVGKRIMAAAARHLATVTLELGGKCPAIVDNGVDLVRTAAMVVAARFRNAGQLCLSVDHVWVPEALRDQFVQVAQGVIAKMFFAEGQLVKEKLPHIVDARNFARVKGYIDDAVARGARVASGGEADPSDFTIAPTILVDVPLDAKVMQDEIFGPILPVLTYNSLEEVTAFVDTGGKPLAMYIFSPDQAFIDQALLETSSGGVTVNGVMMHYAESRLPFGGVNGSGIGRYKGLAGFRELSNARSIFVQAPPA